MKQKIDIQHISLSAHAIATRDDARRVCQDHTYSSYDQMPTKELLFGKKRKKERKDLFFTLQIFIQRRSVPIIERNHDEQHLVHIRLRVGTRRHVRRR